MSKENWPDLFGIIIQLWWADADGDIWWHLLFDCDCLPPPLLQWWHNEVMITIQNKHGRGHSLHHNFPLSHSAPNNKSLISPPIVTINKIFCLGTQNDFVGILFDIWLKSRDWVKGWIFFSKNLNFFDDCQEFGSTYTFSLLCKSLAVSSSSKQNI